ncbi:PorP/SprF family type IX secretion system membrane protein [Pararhodonellum marinum]|uniref:PorP/SprF family type IX secretion system membrane protein n=1 Tax=Pararhodonellum marinum TaxID=2755358 RepID=UPI00188E589F|nr:type IX secretion system membrane protein PorP/SprF [Pararhodonellum marinum]
MKKTNIHPIFTFLGLLMGLFFSHAVFAQQDPQFTHYMYNGMFYNPALAGAESGYNFSALHRTQWLGYSGSNGAGGAPITQLLTGSGRLDQYNAGFGITFVNDDIGPTNNQEVNVSLAYHYSIGLGVLSIGVSGGIFSSTLKYDQIDLVNPDPLVPGSGRENQINTNFGVGVHYDRGNYFVGVSSRHLNEPGFDFGVDEGQFSNQLRNHSYVLAGYRLRTFALWTIEPSLLVKSVSFNNFSYDVSVIATHNNKISGGLAFRGEESLSLLFGYSLLRDNSLRLGYAFDLVISGVEAKAPTSHEFMLSYSLPSATREVQKVIQRTPRFRY